MKKLIIAVITLTSCSVEMPEPIKHGLYTEYVCCDGDELADPPTQPCTIITNDPTHIADRCKKACQVICGDDDFQSTP